MPDIDQKLIDNFSLLIWIVEPIWSKKSFTFLFGGQIGTGPFPNEIGGKGIALTTFAFTFIIFFKFSILIVDIKLIIVWLDLKFKFLIIFSPTEGVTARKIQLQLLTIFWLSFSIKIFLNFLFSWLATLLFREEIIIFLYLIDELQIPLITEEDIFPVPINPKFINKTL